VCKYLEDNIRFEFVSEEKQQEFLKLHPNIPIDRYNRIIFDDIDLRDLQKDIVLSEYIQFENKNSGIFNHIIEANILSDYQRDSFLTSVSKRTVYLENKTYRTNSWYPKEKPCYKKDHFSKINDITEDVCNYGILTKKYLDAINKELDRMGSYKVWDNTIFIEYTEKDVIDSRNAFLIIEYYCEACEKANFFKGKKYHYVYKIRNTSTDELYIGKHSCDKFTCSYFGSGSKLKASIEKLGKDVFVLEKREYFNKEEDAFDNETAQIKANSSKNLLNIVGKNEKPHNKRKRILSTDSPTYSDLFIYNSLDYIKEKIYITKKTNKPSKDVPTEEELGFYSEFKEGCKIIRENPLIQKYERLNSGSENYPKDFINYLRTSKERLDILAFGILKNKYELTGKQNLIILRQFSSYNEKNKENGITQYSRFSRDGIERLYLKALSLGCSEEIANNINLYMEYTEFVGGTNDSCEDFLFGSLSNRVKDQRDLIKSLKR
jgi:hypothetical protein